MFINFGMVFRFFPLSILKNCPECTVNGTDSYLCFGKPIKNKDFCLASEMHSKSVCRRSLGSFREFRMRVVCAWCEGILREIEPLSDSSISHGICPVCRQRVEEEAKESIARRRNLAHLQGQRILINTASP